MRGILAAGLPEPLLAELKHRLPAIPLVTYPTSDEVLAALEQNDFDLLLVNDHINEQPATELLSALRRLPIPPRLPILYCALGHVGAGLASRLVHELGVVRILFHPLDLEGLVEEIQRLVGSARPRARAEEQVLASIVSLWERSRIIFLRHITFIEAAIGALEAGQLDDEMRREAEREAHKLAGSLGVFGLLEGTRLAREIEAQFQLPLAPAAIEHLTNLAVALGDEIERGPVTPHEVQALLPTNRSQVLLVADDPPLIEQLVMAFATHGIGVELASDPEAARRLLTYHLPDVVLLDLTLGASREENLQLLQELAGGSPALPTLVLSERDALTDRVQVTRLGSRGFFQKPIFPAHVVETVMDLLQRLRRDEIRVLAVDDDPQVLATLTLLLEPEGVRLFVLSDPLLFWDLLEESSPDLIILDVDMPYVSGLELCRVVRSDPRWNSLAILALSSHQDSETMRRLYAAGVDDYVQKPIVGPELLTRLFNRLERTQLLRRIAEIDPLTALANRRHSVRLLNQFLRLAERQGEPLAFAALDLDRFKQINDQYGHATGDMVLRRFGQLLADSFRGEDVVARWGGEEFVVGMYGMGRGAGVHRLAEMLETLQEIRFMTPDAANFQLTFSAGVAEYPLDGADLQSLYRAADQALYEAKRAGRARIYPVGQGEAAGSQVLLFSADPALAMLVLGALERRGYQGVWLQQPDDLLATLEGKPAAPEGRIWLLDLDHLDRDRLEGLIMALQGRQTSAIMITQRSSSQVIEQMDIVPPFNQLAKPFEIPVLMQRIRQILEE